MKTYAKHGLRRRGVALVLVVAAVALTAVFAYAMLSGAMVQSRTSGNTSRYQAADSLAESGINLAMYYLQNPTQAPSLPPIHGRFVAVGGHAYSAPGTPNRTWPPASHTPAVAPSA